jgi:hypothetical protein
MGRLEEDLDSLDWVTLLVVITAGVAVIHVFLCLADTWMAGSRPLKPGHDVK